MAKGQQTFAKRQRELDRLKHRADKAEKKRERTDAAKSGDLNDMMAYVDEFGRITNLNPEQQLAAKKAVERKEAEQKRLASIEAAKAGE